MLTHTIFFYFSGSTRTTNFGGSEKQKGIGQLTCEHELAETVVIHKNHSNNTYPLTQTLPVHIKNDLQVNGDITSDLSAISFTELQEK